MIRKIVHKFNGVKWKLSLVGQSSFGKNLNKKDVIVSLSTNIETNLQRVKFKEI